MFHCRDCTKYSVQCTVLRYLNQLNLISQKFPNKLTKIIGLISFLCELIPVKFVVVAGGVVPLIVYGLYSCQNVHIYFFAKTIILKHLKRKIQNGSAASSNVSGSDDHDRIYYFSKQK